jgi:hypothetical protein
MFQGRSTGTSWGRRTTATTCFLPGAAALEEEPEGVAIALKLRGYDFQSLVWLWREMEEAAKAKPPFRVKIIGRDAP